MEKSLKLEDNVVRLTLSAMMIALGTVLSLVQFIKMPSGGGVTLLSMLPVILVAYIYGVKWGCFTGAVYGVFQLLVGMDALKGLSVIILIGSFLLDYVFAFGSLGFAGIFKNKIKNQVVAFSLGTALVCVLRFLCHFISGFLLYSDIVGDTFGSVAYSFVYNITYMGPEMVITIIGAAVFAGTFNLVTLAKKK